MERGNSRQSTSRLGRCDVVQAIESRLETEGDRGSSAGDFRNNPKSGEWVVVACKSLLFDVVCYL